jgi:large subunit ribosomal protein L10
MTEKKQTKKPIKSVPKRKIKEVEELTNLIKNRKTILLASIKNIPASLLQELSKKLRKTAEIKIPKKSLMFRALDNSGNEAVKKLKEQINDSVAVLFSDLDSFALAAELVKNKRPAKAKAGQEAPDDIEIPEGPTDLVPGPAITELGALGIQIQIEKGKIHIKQSKVIVKRGEKISANASEVMNKLDIKPFSIGFIPLAAFDTQENKMYLEIRIDQEATLKDLKDSFTKALAFAVEIEYISKDTISFLIQKAARHEKALEKLNDQTKSEGG